MWRLKSVRTMTARGLAWLAVSVVPISAQGTASGKAGPRAVLEREYEISLAVSAAPDAVSGDATVLVWNGSGFEKAREGSNGVTCYVARSWPDSLEPHCFDAEGSVTILPIHMRQMELQHQGLDGEAVQEEIARGIASGEFRLPSRPAMSYMMSRDQQLISDSGDETGNWMPHRMIYYPYLTQEALGLGGRPSTDAAIVADPGTRLSNIMIVVREFAEGGGEG
ncbi:MAG: hypothetical protein OEO23_11055 [Gemmatimonadota bacterium]|nr:hypothetical protein [Gemmatimonadota bacterium]